RFKKKSILLLCFYVHFEAAKVLIQDSVSFPFLEHASDNKNKPEIKPILSHIPDWVELCLPNPLPVQQIVKSSGCVLIWLRLCNSVCSMFILPWLVTTDRYVFKSCDFCFPKRCLLFSYCILCCCFTEPMVRVIDFNPTMRYYIFLEKVAALISVGGKLRALSENLSSLNPES
uniref:Uncharacterized protein n=1 Tax=Erpetoichthys calabaricus TaxID=27687 RepID=A0A8C4RK88_ERPCA